MISSNFLSCSSFTLNCPVWHSSLTCTLNNQLVDIQRRALRIIYPQMSYKDSITQFNLPTFMIDVNSYVNHSIKMPLARTVNYLTFNLSPLLDITT